MPTPSQDIFSHTKQRLEECNCFSPQTIQTVAAVAQQQVRHTRYRDFLHIVGVPTVQLHVAKGGSGVTFVDIPAKTKQIGVLVIHLPMGNPLDSNQLFQVATIAAAVPNYRVIGFGNPSGGRYAFRRQNLSMKQRRAIARGGNVEPLVAAELDYLKSQGVRRVVHAGYSYGALKAMFASYYESAVEVQGLICIEPVAHPRSIIQLTGDFLRTDSPLNKYVNRSKIPAFIDARKHGVDGLSYRRGLVRPINIAVAFLLARTDFMMLFKKILIKRPAIHAVVAWGGKSELGNDAHMTTMLQNITSTHPRVHAFRFAEDTHALANDLHIHAAIILEALTRMR